MIQQKKPWAGRPKVQFFVWVTRRYSSPATMFRLALGSTLQELLPEGKVAGA